MNVIDNFTLEEIYLVKSCNTNRKDSTIQILKKYLIEKYVNNYDAGMIEIIHNTLDKLQKLQEQDFIELIDYPI